MASERRRALTTRELKPRIQRLSWERLTQIHLATKSQGRPPDDPGRGPAVLLQDQRVHPGTRPPAHGGELR